VKIPVREALSRGVAQLQAAGIESARLDARILLSQALHIPSDSMFPGEAAPDQIELFESLVARRAAREPLAYIRGYKEFWSLDFEVGPGVLIPRPETETLIEEALRRFPDSDAPVRILDIGTGSGCLLVSFLKERPNARGVGIDSSEAALSYARRNAARHDLAGRCRFALAAADAPPGKIGSAWVGDAGIFELIFANPPYLTDEEFTASVREIKDYEPQKAFVGGPVGLEGFHAFLPLAARCLSTSGVALFEIGAGQRDKVTEIVRGEGLEVGAAISDLSGIPRCLVIGHAGEGSPLAPLKNSVGKGPATR
jgi:release factor glutamine methyltransferase